MRISKSRTTASGALNASPRLEARRLDAQRLLSLSASADGAFGESTSVAPQAEATALAALALLAAGEGDARLRDLAVESARALATWQLPDGRVPAASALEEAGWTTPLSLLAWEVAGVEAQAAARAVSWLLTSGSRVPDAESVRISVMGHDLSIPGWPWVGDTHAWVEPTAMALLALARGGRADHPRARDGVRLLLDRGLHGGGWNYGNTSVFGRGLRPHPGPTGLALAALAGRCAGDHKVQRSLDYLEACLESTRAPESVGWALIGLAAWDRMPADADRWLASSFDVAFEHPRPCRRLALLLIAMDPHLLLGHAGIPASEDRRDNR